MDSSKSTPCREAMKEDLMRVYREVSGSYECKTMTEAWERVVEHPAPRFYIDARRAHLYIAPLLRGDRTKISQLSALKQQMYEALFDVVMRLWKEDKYYGRSLCYVLQYAILEPAPRFYIDVWRMRQIWIEKTQRRRKS